MVGVNKCHRLMPTDMSNLVVTRVKLEVFTWKIHKHIIITTESTVINKNRQVIKTWKIYPIYVIRLILKSLKINLLKIKSKDCVSTSVLILVNHLWDNFKLAIYLDAVCLFWFGFVLFWRDDLESIFSALIYLI